MSAVFCVAALHGLLYVFLIPPWEHYDEPTHFEYGWWIANRLRLPQEGDIDAGMRRELAASMQEHGFYRDRGGPPNLLPQEEAIPIGISEFGHPPLYYALIALPLRFVRHTDITFQLYLGRMVSLSLYLSSIAIAYGLVGELVAPGHVLRWMVPGAMVLLPSYTDLMTAVNSDAGAVVAFSLFLWSAVRLIVRTRTRAPDAAHAGRPKFVGRRLVGAAWVLLFTAWCVLTKSTAAIAVLLAPLALALAWLRRTPRAVVIVGAILALGGLVAVVLLKWGDAALWFRFTSQRLPTSQRVANAPSGTRALALDFEPDAVGPDGTELDTTQDDRLLLQFLPNKDVEAVRGLTVTLSAWIWATRPATVRTLALEDDTQYVVRVVDVDRTPAFYALTATVAAEAKYVQVILRPSPQVDANNVGTPSSPLVVYYDDVGLAEQVDPLANRLRNGSAERTWPYVRPAIDAVFKRYTRRSLSQFLTSILDWRRTAYVYDITARTMFQSFWARFGWNGILLAQGWYRALGVLTLFGAAGAVLGTVRLKSTQLSVRRAVWMLLCAALIVWLNAILRVHPVVGRPFIPVARYAYPAIVPSMLALVGGWLNLVPRHYRRWVVWLVFAAFLTIDVASIWTLWLFHYGRA